MKRTLTLISCLIILAALLLLRNFVSLPPRVEAQFSCCYPPLNPPAAAKWPKYYTVTVTIEGGSDGLTETERQAVEDAFRAWNASQAADCTQVVFTGFQFGADPGRTDKVFWVEFRDEEGDPGITNITQGSVGPIPFYYARTVLRRSIRRGTPSALPAYINPSLGLVRLRASPPDTGCN